MGSHSLRIGGATAMYHVVDDLQVVRRFERKALALKSFTRKSGPPICTSGRWE